MRRFNVRVLPAALLCVLVGGCGSGTQPPSSIASEDAATAGSASLGSLTPVSGPVPDLEGVWVEMLMALDDPRWRLRNLVCRGCAFETVGFAEELLNDPATDSLPLAEVRAKIEKRNKAFIESLYTEAMRKFKAGYDHTQDPVNDCVPSGFFRADGPLPIKIEQFEDRVVIHYEYWNSVRTVYLNTRTHPEGLQPSRLGHSVGWYDDGALVVETVGIAPHLIVAGGVDAILVSERSIGIERFSRDGDLLDYELTVVDPVALRRPLTFAMSRLLVPGLELDTSPVCEAKSGQLEEVK